MAGSALSSIGERPLLLYALRYMRRAIDRSPSEGRESPSAGFRRGKQSHDLTGSSRFSDVAAIFAEPSPSLSESIVDACAA